MGFSSQEYDHPAGLFLLCKLSLIQQRDDAAEAVKRLLEHPEMSIDLILSVSDLCTDHGKSSLAIEALEGFLAKPGSRAKDTGRVIAKLFEKLISPPFPPDRARQLMARVVADYSSSTGNNFRLDDENAKQLVCTVWNAAVASYQLKDYNLSHEWFSQCQKLLQFCPISFTHVDRWKCLRAIGHLCVLLGNWEGALEAAKQALEGDPGDPFAQYTVFQSALLKRDQHAALNALRAIRPEPSNEVLTLFELCAQNAIERGAQDIAIAALDLAVDRCVPKVAEARGRSALLLRTMIQVELGADGQAADSSHSLSAISRVVLVIRRAVSALQEHGAQFFGTDIEMRWFHGISWNLGIEAATHGDYIAAADLFRAACAFSDVSCESPKLRSLALIMAASSMLESATEELGEAEATTILSYVEKVRQIVTGEELDESDRSRFVQLLYLAEFRTMVLVHRSNLIDIVHAAEKVPEVTASVFEMMASYCTGKGKNCEAEILASSEALKRSLQLYNLEKSINYRKMSRVYRKLINSTRTREESLPFFEEISKILKGLPQQLFPQADLQWFIATAWNNGVYFLRLIDYPKAERWMGLSLNLSKFHEDAKQFESSLLPTYTDVLAQASGRTVLMEE